MAKMRLNKLSEELRTIMREDVSSRAHEVINPDWLQPYLEKHGLGNLTFEGLLDKNSERTFYAKVWFIKLFFSTFYSEKTLISVATPIVIES